MIPTLQFAHIEYSIQTRSIDIFSIGCDGHCKGCCNQQLKDWNQIKYDSEYALAQTLRLVTMFPKIIDRILLVGGDPVDAYLHYPSDMLKFIYRLREQVKLPIYLFTRYAYEDVPRILLPMVDYVKTGAYIPELKTDDNVQYGIKLATSNQVIHECSTK